MTSIKAHGSAVGSSPISKPIPAPPPHSIDILDYFSQSPDIAQHATIGGVNVRPDHDPDASSRQTLVLTKFSKPFSYEVYYITPTQLQLRYEVVRPDPQDSAQDWIRRYQQISPDAKPGDGALWMPRYVTPGKTNFFSRAAVDRFRFDPDIRAYVIDPPHSMASAVSFNSIVWASDPWKLNNRTGQKIDRVLRLITQWQPEGKIIESYDYAQGLGLVNWQWIERISTLQPLAGDRTGRIFHCENGAIYIQSQGDSIHPPGVMRYDIGKRQIGAALPVILFKSHWAPQMGAQWYVIYRSLAREAVLEKRDELIPHDYSLPEWRTNPGHTIADLSGFYTRK